MAKTVTESVGNIGAGVLPTSQEITQVGAVQPTQVRAGDAISRDLATIMDVGGKLVQEDNTLSKNAAKRVAVDNLKQMGEDLNAIKVNSTPDMDKRDIAKANEAVYQFYGNRLFENEDAQREFDGMYHVAGAKAVDNMNTLLKVEQNKIDATANFNAGAEDAFILVEAGIPLDRETADTLVETMTAGGWYTKDQAWEAITGQVGQAIQGKYETLKKLPNYYINNRLNVKLHDKLFNEYFQSVGTMENGSVTPANDSIPAEAVNKAQNTYNALIAQVSDDKDSRSLHFREITTAPTDNPNATLQNLSRLNDEINEYMVMAQTGEIKFNENTYNRMRNNASEMSVNYDMARFSNNYVDQMINGTANLEAIMDNKDYFTLQQYSELGERPEEVRLKKETVARMAQNKLSELDAVYTEGMEQGQNNTAILQSIVALENNSGQKGSIATNSSNVLGGHFSSSSPADMLIQIRGTRSYMDAKDPTNMMETTSWLNDRNMLDIEKVYQDLNVKFENKDITMDEFRTKLYGYTHSRMAVDRINKVNNPQARKFIEMVDEQPDLIWGFDTEAVMPVNAKNIIANKVGMEDIIDKDTMATLSKEKTMTFDWQFFDTEIRVVKPTGYVDSATEKFGLRAITERFEELGKGTEYSDLEVIAQQGSGYSTIDNVTFPDGTIGIVVQLYKDKTKTDPLYAPQIFSGQELLKGYKLKASKEGAEANRSSYGNRRSTNR